MKKIIISTITAALLAFPVAASAQTEETPSEQPLVITLEQALEIALSENVSVKVADKEVERTGYAKRGSYASLFPQIDITGAYQRTIKKQVMYMDGGGFDFSKMIGEALGPMLEPLYAAHGIQLPESGGQQEEEGGSSSTANGISVGRWNTWSAGISAVMPIINAQLWESIKLSGKGVELAVEKARASRMSTVTQVKQAFYSVLLAKEAFEVYKDVYENAVQNFEQTEKRYNAQKASELEYIRAKTTVANAIPNVYSAESTVILALWQLKAVMGIDLDREIDVAGSLEDFGETMFRQFHEADDDISLENNTTMRQLAIQAEQLATAIRVQKFAYIPSLALQFSFNMNAMTNDFKFSTFNWTPYSYVGVSLSIPIFSGGKRYHDVKVAKNQYEQIQLQSADVERGLKIAIRQSLNTMETNMKSYYAAQSAVEMAQKAYDIAQKSYQVGHSTLIELNDAQLALTQSKLGQSQAIYNFMVAKAQLEETIGADFTE